MMSLRQLTTAVQELGFTTQESPHHSDAVLG